MLTRWTRPTCYIGPEWPEYFVFLDRTRDSDSATRSNFICALKALGGVTETVRVIREHHWLVGWVEWIAIHESDHAALRAASDILRELEVYPIVDEDHWSELEYTEAEDFWAGLPLRDRIELCREYGLSVFAARRDYIPDNGTGALVDYLRQV